MEFLKNNLAIIISIITIISGCFNIYQYIENRRLKKYGTEKDLKRRRASLEKLCNEHQSNSWLLVRVGEKEKEKNDFICREKELMAEIEYLEKILEIKNFMNLKNKKLKIILLAISIFLLGIGIGLWMGKIKYAQNKSIFETSGDKKSYVGDFKVTRVVDGDTIEIEGGERVRYIGIDTPETVDPRKPVQCFGVEASNKNKELVAGKTVRLEKDTTDRDKYQRLLRYVYVGDDFVNLELVKQGFAYSYSYPPDIKYQDQFLQAQREAEKAKSGLWSACPAEAAKSASVPEKNIPVEKETAAGDCAIKGNISTSGEKIYHLPGCGSYAKTTIEESRGEKMFCAETEAQAAGFRKALNCQ